MSIFKKKKFFSDVPCWEIPEQRFFFRKIVHAKSFTGHISQYFSKILKGGIRRDIAASKLSIGITNFDLKIFFLRTEISKHAA